MFQPQFELSSGGEKELNFFLKFSCKPGLVLAPNVTSQRVECSYDSDYYEFAWEQNDAPRCIGMLQINTFYFIIPVTYLN